MDWDMYWSCRTEKSHEMKKKPSSWSPVKQLNLTCDNSKVAKKKHPQASKNHQVGGWTNPFEKYWSKWESSPNTGENKNVWNHQPVMHVYFLIFSIEFWNDWVPNLTFKKLEKQPSHFTRRETNQKVSIELTQSLASTPARMQCVSTSFGKPYKLLPLLVGGG